MKVDLNKTINALKTTNNNERLCVKNKNRVKYLTNINNDKFTKWNKFRKLFGMGPLSHTQSSMESISRHLIAIFKHPDFVKMDANSQEQQTTIKIVNLTRKLAEKSRNEAQKIKPHGMWMAEAKSNQLRRADRLEKQCAELEKFLNIEEK